MLRGCIFKVTLKILVVQESHQGSKFKQIDFFVSSNNFVTKDEIKSSYNAVTMLQLFNCDYLRKSYVIKKADINATSC